MKRIKYIEEEANTWIYPVRKGYRIKCCKCGLVHVFDFRIVKQGKRNYIEFRANLLRRNKK